MRAESMTVVVSLVFGFGLTALGAETPIPLPEHPRPDFERAAWLNLNGPWAFRPDPEDRGLAERWWEGAPASFPGTILVPFPWGSKLSGVGDSADIAWYARRIRVPEGWDGLRVFLVVGASDWLTAVWLDGELLGRHRGGYTPFEFELTPRARAGSEHALVLRADDSPHPFKLEGKQGYGRARGIWQTVYLEARPWFHLRRIRFVPDVDRSAVDVEAALSAPAPAGAVLKLASPDGAFASHAIEIPENAAKARATIPVPSARLWTLDDPFLYRVAAALEAPGRPADRVETYFGMRKIGVATPQGSPGFGPYVALNGRPIYLQMTLDQAYHPDGFYTFPSDEFVRDEILRARRIGLNAIRIHVKIDSPRKLYWADRLGVLVMADVPNSWGEPTPEMRAEAEKALFGMIERDFNHPAVFSWVLFNETWGLFSAKGRDREYLPETQAWVEDLYRRVKALDPTRLVEDNSPCNHDHVATDLNTWHAYLPGYAWREHLDRVVKETFPGSGWNFVPGRAQGTQPLLNSECGNVWGYEGSTGDVDWSWDYHIMMDEFRRHPKIGGWLYTEHHDVVNEWNGYYRYDRSPKITGLSQLVPGTSLRDLHAPIYLAPGTELCTDAQPGEAVRVPLWASFLTETSPGDLSLRWELAGWDSLGREETYARGSAPVRFSPWRSEEIAPLSVTMPPKRAVAILRLSLEDLAGRALHRNFRTFVVGGAPSPRDEVLSLDGRAARVLRFAPADFRAASWTLAQTSVLGGLKVSGMGSGFFEYRAPWPSGLRAERVSSASFLAELSAKKLHGKDRPEGGKEEGDFMLGRGTHDPSLNPNSYPMTDTVRHPSAVRVRVSGVSLGTRDLEDDPADHRGILSWHAQPRDRKLREAGSYGYLVDFTIPEEALRAAEAAGEIVLRLEVDPALPGGLAVYGERFGRYPLEPSLVFALK
ncbi:MAG: glycoside hydrolase family 2 protein [Planctomycetota bacterium]